MDLFLNYSLLPSSGGFLILFEGNEVSTNQVSSTADCVNKIKTCHREGDWNNMCLNPAPN